MKQRLINKLLYKYNGTLKEVIHQKNLFSNYSEYIATLLKLQGYINTIQSIQLRQILFNL